MFNLIKQGLASKEAIAEMLKTSPEKLEEFETAYKGHVLTDEIDSDNLFDINSKQASRELRTGTAPECDEEYVVEVAERIVGELMAVSGAHLIPDDLDKPLVTNEDLKIIPEGMRPQLTGTLVKVDLACNSGIDALCNLKRSLDAQNEKDQKMWYHLFRQGLDILDLDPILYEMLGMNPNSIEHWFPALKSAADKQDFFKIPETKIIQVPLPILQLTRLDYFSLTPVTLKIVDDWCMRAFDLDVDKTYFIKTGTYSSKFDFRNAKVEGEKEVRELGEYLLFIHFQANQMAGPLSSPCIYGVSTTNRWVVREYIEDKEDNPTIYKGLPLHTEYRIFADMDTKEILGIAPYWDPKVMRKRFSEDRSIHDMHDYITFTAHESTLMKRYNENKDRVAENIKKLIKDMDLNGQWSIDVMQNGDDFWIIDMALAEWSALRECIPPEKVRISKENWIPAIGDGQE